MADIDIDALGSVMWVCGNCGSTETQDLRQPIPECCPEPSLFTRTHTLIFVRYGVKSHVVFEATYNEAVPRSDDTIRVSASVQRAFAQAAHDFLREHSVFDVRAVRQITGV